MPSLPTIEAQPASLPHSPSVESFTQLMQRPKADSSEVSSPPPMPPAVSVNRDVNLRDSLRYFAAGTVAGMTGVVVGQPFDTIKVRMQTQVQVHQFSASLAQQQASRRNFAVSYYQPAPIFSVGANPTWTGPKANTVAMHSVTAVAPAAPLFSSTRACFVQTVRSAGVRGLYRGMASPLLLVGCQKSVAFGVFGTVAQHLQGRQPLPTLAQVWAAGVAGGIANSLILTPIDQFKIAMQIQSYSTTATTSGAEHSLTAVLAGSTPQPSLLRTAQQLIVEQGFLRGVYGNFGATLLREIPMYSIYYTLYSHLHRNYIVDHENRSRWTPPTSPAAPSTVPLIRLLTDGQKEVLTKLSLGGLTGVGCWASCYPLDTIKSSMIAQTAQNVRLADRKSIPQMVRFLYANGGIRSFYNGLTPALLRAFPVHAVVFFTFSTMSEWLQENGM